MSDQNTHDPNNQAEGATPQHHAQPWREERHQPEPKAIEGNHAGRHVPEDLQRQAGTDSEVGATSRVAGDTGGSGGGDDGSDSNYGTSGDSTHQGSSSTPGRRSGTTHATGQGRNTEGAFGEEQSGDNANNLSDYRDAGIAKRETGTTGPGDRTQGGTQ